MGTIDFTYQGKPIQLVVSDHGVIDATNLFNNATYMNGGAAAWTIPAKAPAPVADVLHHTAGWYGPRLTEKATPAEEWGQIVALAQDHRARFGIGPGYHYLAFPSGRAWAVGKYGTHRAHTTGREPTTRERWNVVAKGICAFGNFEADAVPRGTITAIRAILTDLQYIRRGTVLPLHEHGLTPTVDAAGVKRPQATACPGRHLAAARAAGQITVATFSGLAPVYQPDRWGEGYAAGYKRGRADEAVHAHDAIDALTARLRATVANPPAPSVVPPAPALGGVA
ncbi:MAG: hypothetical protein AMXMBFR23_03370 [Chloroflexota bacterium]